MASANILPSGAAPDDPSCCDRLGRRQALQAELDASRRALDTALIHGDDTKGARDAVRAAEKALADIEEEIERAREAAEREQATADWEAGAKIVEAADTVLSNTIRDLRLDELEEKQ